MSNNEQSSIEWYASKVEDYLKETYGVAVTDMNLLAEAKAMHKKEILFAYMKTLPIEDGVFTAIDKAHEYYNETFGGNNEQQ